MKKITMIGLMLIMTSAIFAYKPLTLEQADNYADSVEYNTILELIIDYDYIEHTVPKVTIPRIDYLLIGNDLLITPANDIIITHNKFKWKVDYPQKTIYNFKQEEKQGIPVGALIISVTGALLVGFAIGSVL